MRTFDTLTFLLVHLSFLSSVALIYVVAKKSRYSPVRTAFYATTLTIIIWNLGTMMEMDYRLITGKLSTEPVSIILIDLCYLAICFIPVCILYLGRLIWQPYWKPTVKHGLLLVIPFLSFVMVCTNPLHGLFFRSFSLNSVEAVYGPYFYFHSIYSYTCILIGILYMAFFSIQNTGIFTRQSLLVLIGFLVPLGGNTMYSFGLVNLPFSINACLFTVSIICMSVAFFKYRFVAVPPIAVSQLVDLISDGYLVTDAMLNIIEYNRALTNLLPEINPMSEKITLHDFFNRCNFDRPGEEYMILLTQSATNKTTVTAEISAPHSRYFNLKITPIFHEKEFIGSVILIKDITDVKLAIKTIQQSQVVLMEQERLASLGQLAGGIAHNLKTPIFSIAGGTEALRVLVDEYYKSIEQPSVNANDHRAIAGEMLKWIRKIESHCDYISDMITSIKGQAVQMNSNDIEHFTISQFLYQVEMLMTHELRKHHCELILDVGTAEVSAIIAGNINSLVQVFDNLIINALYAYGGQAGKIVIRVRQVEQEYVFTVTDNGCGIPAKIKEKLFREMITTKGKQGSGLGLYLSYSTITGKFGGKISVESTLGKGTEFTICIPVPCAESPVGDIAEDAVQNIAVNELGDPVEDAV